MFRNILRILFMIILGFISGVLGLFIGMLIGGNHAEQFMFNGVQGYEATGQIGFILGALTGFISGWWFLFKKISVKNSR
jgi:hypothetical protein